MLITMKKNKILEELKDALLRSTILIDPAPYGKPEKKDKVVEELRRSGTIFEDPAPKGRDDYGMIDPAPNLIGKLIGMFSKKK